LTTEPDELSKQAPTRRKDAYLREISGEPDNYHPGHRFQPKETARTTERYLVFKQTIIIPVQERERERHCTGAV
jgi:hypothetical protein